jgi:hypothetical protein
MNNHTDNKKLSPYEENKKLRKLYLKYKKKYCKYKAKYFIEKDKNNPGYLKKLGILNFKE